MYETVQISMVDSKTIRLTFGKLLTAIALTSKQNNINTVLLLAAEILDSVIQVKKHEADRGHHGDPCSF